VCHGRAGEACGRGQRMAAAMWSLLFTAAATRGAQDGGPALRLDLPAAAAAAGGPIALLGRRPAPKQAARRRPGEGERGSARCAAAPFGVASRAGVAAGG